MLPIVKRLTVTDYQGARVGIVVGSELRNGDGLPELQGGEPCLLIGRKAHWKCLSFVWRLLCKGLQSVKRKAERLLGWVA